MKTVFEMIEEKKKKAENGPWFPASGGTETPFKSRSGYRLLYCFQPSTGKHAYLNVDTDMILSNEDAEILMGKI